MAQNFIENIFIEIEIQCLNTTKDIIIGLSIEYQIIIFFFNQEQSYILQKIYKRKQIHIFNGWLS